MVCPKMASTGMLKAGAGQSRAFGGRRKTRARWYGGMVEKKG
ncbi:hypothetical protein B4135_4235 [Caldibacillus debilis]|uniref:Uncharacterized protein n=1 Tax=Caldibacillus debilis TaxID=301148 RepID=A0A150L5H8_9BACI|nr:hypothetical protein B4135_4235 [Caldibacillus debilis]